MVGKKIIATVGVAMAALALAATAAPQADAAAYSKRCAEWKLNEGDELFIDALSSKATTCAAAKQVGDAYLASSKWWPQTLRAAGRTWKLTYRDSRDADVEGCDRFGRSDILIGSYKSLTYEARTPKGRYMVSLEYDYHDC